MKIEKQFKMIDLFCGIGGVRLGFENTKKVKTILSSDIDPFASKTYELNFGDNPLSDITKIKEKDIPDFDIISAGFPCQAFSQAGKRLGFEDTRGTLFFDVARIIKEKKPKVVFLENVKGLLSHDKGKTWEIMLLTLEELGYDIYHQVLNTMTHGNIPQNRSRVYIVGFRKDLNIKSFKFPDAIPLTKDFKNFINRSEKQSDTYYYTSRFGIYNEVKKEVVKDITAYQWRRTYVRENKGNVSPTLTANMGTGGHNVPLILDNYGVRKLTPRECFNLQGFPSKYKFPDKMSDSKLYKQAGNSVSVSVIERIAKEIMKYL